MPTMDEYLAMMQPDPEANRKARIFQALGGLGAGLLGGGGWQRGLARGGLLAHDAMNDASNRASSDQMAQFKMRAAAQEMADKDSARESEAQFGKQLAAITSTAPRLNNMGTGGPTPANAAAVAPPDRVERLRQVAEFYAQNNKPDQAKKYFDAADAMEGTFSVDPKVGLGADGKPQFGQFSNKGRDPRIAQGFTPPPDLQAVNLGDKTQFVDKLTTAPGTTFAAGMSPDAKARNAVDWANINDRRAKESAEAKGTAGAAKPTWDSSSGQFVYPPSPDSPQGRAVAPQGYSGKADMNAAKSEKALIAIKEAEDLIDTATGSYFGTGIDEGARFFGSATPGAKASAQLKVAEASIMMNQPRMEGPQSNLDVAMYRQAAGQIGDSTVPSEQKKAALETIRALHKKYAQMGKPQSVGASGGWSIEPVK